MKSVINSFPGYEYVNGKNMYHGEDVGKGGYVYAEPGIWGNVALLDIQSMHPSSILAMNCFGDYTDRFRDIFEARLAIKHGEYDKAKNMLGGKLEPYLGDKTQAKALSGALKTAINSVYGLTSASFDNPFRDIRNVNNIVALRGALFMVNLKEEVQKQGFYVAHIKTDSIKIPDYSDEIVKFCMDYAADYGYSFEFQAVYNKMCLVNDAVYIALVDKDYEDPELNGKWTATGAQFAHPYVFKTMFSHEPVIFEDLCETKSVNSALYLDFNENLPEGQHNYRFVGKIGQFVPVKDGCGGAKLLRENTNSEGFSSVSGAKDYRWKEAEILRSNAASQDQIDYRYYAKLVDDAFDHIKEFGPAEWFCSDELYSCPPFVGGPIRR